MSAADRFWAWTTPVDEADCHSVAAWAGSAPVLAGLAVAAGPDEWVQRLRRMWPELEPGAEASLTVWADDPWSRGAYSVLPPVATKSAEAIAARQGPSLLIAGEHTAEPGWTGTMEGALRSGLRAAGELLAGD
jgi:monoamine oxidase